MGVSLQTYRLRIGTYQQGFSQGCQNISHSETDKVDLKSSLKIVLIMNSLLVIVAILNQYHMDQSLYSHKPNQLPITESIPPPSWEWSCLPSSTSKGGSLSWSGPPTSTYKSYISKKHRNFLARMLHGNRSQRGHGIKLIHWNKGPAFLHNKHQEIEVLIANHRPHVLGLSEANLKSVHDFSQVQHQDYDLHTCGTLTNPELGISRIAVYSHKSLVVKRRVDLEDNTISAIWLEIGLPRQKKILHCQAYREWQHLGQVDHLSGSIAAQLQRWELFLDKWELALMEGKEVVVMMDANIDFLKWSRDDLPTSDSTYKLKPLIEKLFSKIFPHGVSQLVKAATRTWPGQADSGLDHIYTNKPEKLSEVTSEYMGGSDHKLLKVVRFSKSLKPSARYTRKRCFKNFKPEEFVKAVKELSWYDVYSCQDANMACQILTSKLCRVLDTMAPIRTIQIHSKYAPWLSDSTKELIKERNYAQKVASASGNIDDWRYYKHLRNSTTSKMRVEKRNWESKKLNNCEHDTGTLWKNVKSFIGWNKSGPPSQLFHNGKFENSPAGLASTMNNFFVEKVAQLRDKIPLVDIDPHAKLREAFKNRNCSFKLKPVAPDEVLKIIKCSKSSGVDFIDTATIKLVAMDILPAITHIINLSISQCTFPSMWKHAKIIPLLKKGDPLVAKNYRPVALLPIFSKILEKAVFKQIVDYLDQNRLLSSNHHGSRSGHSTATALIQMYDQWVQEVDNNKMVGVMMIDLSAAFDMVDHGLLIQKLALFGLDEDAVQWCSSYLSGRTQSVFIDGHMSPPARLQCGVPQGSILGPLMYILYTNDLPDLAHDHPVSYESTQSVCSHCGSTVCYVDDGTFSVGHRDPDILSQKLTHQYGLIADYMAANKLVINGDKTHLVVMGAKNKNHLRNRISLSAGSHTILPTPTERLLGAIVSQDLKWNHHIQGNKDSLTKQLTSRINGLAMLSSRTSMKTKLRVANGIVMSKLCYLMQLWGGIDGQVLKSLQVLQNKAARIVTGSGWFTPKRRLLKLCRWLSVKQLIFYQSVVLTHKIATTGSPLYLASRMSTEHPRRTRQATTGCIRYGENFTANQSLIQKSFCHRAIGDYNSIPADIRVLQNMQTFKVKLKKWVEMNIPVD